LGDLELVDNLGKIRKDGHQMILAFGRHKGRDIKEIQFEDPRYIHWLLSAKGIEDESAREVIRTYLDSDQ
jgi:hypothetical protein